MKLKTKSIIFLVLAIGVNTSMTRLSLNCQQTKIQKYFIENQSLIDEIFHLMHQSNCEEFNGYTYKDRILENYEEFNLLQKNAIVPKSYPEECIFPSGKKKIQLLEEFTHLIKDKELSRIRLSIPVNKPDKNPIVCEFLDFYDQLILNKKADLPFQSEMFIGSTHETFTYGKIKRSDYYYRVRTN